MTGSRELIAKLIEIGYTDAREFDSTNIDFLFYNKKLEPFLNWICKISSANVIPHAELTEYNQMVESGEKIFEVEELEELGTFVPDRKFHEVLANQTDGYEDSKTAKWRTQTYEKRKRIVYNLKKRLNVGQSIVFEDCARLKAEWAAAKRHLDRAIVDCESANGSMNMVQKSIDTLLVKVFDVVRSSAQSSNVWFFALDFEAFWKNSDDCVQEILARMKKTFNTENVEQMKRQEAEKQWLQISREGYLKCELDLYQTEMKHEGVKVALAEARKILESMNPSSVTYNCWQPHSMRDTKSVQEFAAENSTFFDTEIVPKVVKKRDLILDYFSACQCSAKREIIAQSTAMLQAAISQLAGIEARVRFVSVAVDVERELLTRIGSFVDDLNENLGMEVNRFDERKRTMTELSNTLIQRASGSLQTDSVISKILDTDESRLLVGEKSAAVKQQLVRLEENIMAQRDALDLKFQQEIFLSVEMDRSLNLLIGSVWHDCATQIEIPPLTPRVVAQALNEIATNSQKVEENLVAAINDQQNKMVLLSADELLPLKRKLYAYFYVDQETFKRALEAIRCKKTKPKEI